MKEEDLKSKTGELYKVPLVVFSCCFFSFTTQNKKEKWDRPNIQERVMMEKRKESWAKGKIEEKKRELCYETLDKKNGIAKRCVYMYVHRVRLK